MGNNLQKINIENDRLIIKIGTDFYYAEIFYDDRSFEYQSMRCGNCKHSIFTEFIAKKIPDRFLQKVKYTPDIEIDYKANKEEFKFIICDKCLNININEDVVGVIDDGNISYTYLINDKKIDITDKLHSVIMLFFLQTQKNPINIILDSSYEEELKKYLNAEELKEIEYIKNIYGDI